MKPTVCGKWSDVNKRLPEVNKDVLICAKNKISSEKIVTITSMKDEVYYGSTPIKLEKPRWRAPWQYFFENYEITHWMPLPEPPADK